MVKFLPVSTNCVTRPASHVDDPDLQGPPRRAGHHLRHRREVRRQSPRGARITQTRRHARRSPPPSAQLTLRPSLRKERKIRPGYSPAEDALKFKSTRMQDAESKALPKGAVVGRPAPSAASVAIANAHLTAAARKNAKRKEKRKAGGDEEADGKVEVAPPDDWDADDPDEAKPATVPTAAEDETAHDPEKRARALQKKIKQVRLCLSALSRD
jgi:hypothetical protein